MLSRIRHVIRVAALLSGMAGALPYAAAQAPDPLANPNLQIVDAANGYAVLPLPDGSAIVGGQFYDINGTSRLNVAKIRSDGTLDTEWNPTADGGVEALAYDGNGNVYLAGD